MNQRVVWHTLSPNRCRFGDNLFNQKNKLTNYATNTHAYHKMLPIHDADPYEISFVASALPRFPGRSSACAVTVTAVPWLTIVVVV